MCQHTVLPDKHMLERKKKGDFSKSFAWSDFRDFSFIIKLINIPTWLPD